MEPRPLDRRDHRLAARRLRGKHLRAVGRALAERPRAHGALSCRSVFVGKRRSVHFTEPAEPGPGAVADDALSLARDLRARGAPTARRAARCRLCARSGRLRRAARARRACGPRASRASGRWTRGERHIYLRDVVTKYAGTATARDAYLRLAESFDAIRYREDKAEVCATLRERYPADREVTTICGAKPPVQADTARRNTL